MKTFQEIIEGDTDASPLAKMAINWIEGQLKHFHTAEEQVAWAKERIDEDQLEKLDALRLSNYFKSHETEDSEDEYSDFLFMVSATCGNFMAANGVKPSGEEQRFLDKMGY